MEEIQGIELAENPNVSVMEMDGMSIERVISRFKKIEQIKEHAMVPDIDYGIIPGTGGKPTLLKPGAEKLCVLFELGARAPILKEIREGNHYTVTCSIGLFHIPSGRNIGTGIGMSSTREKKYAWRTEERKCPVCGAAAILKSKFEDASWYCFTKKGGCNAKFAKDDPKIVNQKAGQIENPDLPDTWNTVLKMAAKRALVDGVLRATGSSAYFIQDAEDVEHIQIQPVHQSATTARKEEPKKAEVKNENDPKRFDTYKQAAGVLGINENDAMKIMYAFLGKDNPMKITGEDIHKATKHLADHYSTEAKV